MLFNINFQHPYTKLIDLIKYRNLKSFEFWSDFLRLLLRQMDIFLIRKWKFAYKIFKFSKWKNNQIFFDFFSTKLSSVYFYRFSSIYSQFLKIMRYDNVRLIEVERIDCLSSFSTLNKNIKMNDNTSANNRLLFFHSAIYKLLSIIL